LSYNLIVFWGAHVGLKPIVHIVLTLALLFSNVVAVHTAEANFWSERRLHSKRVFPSQGTRSPPSDPSSLLLAQLPGALPLPFAGKNPIDKLYVQDLGTKGEPLPHGGVMDGLGPLVNPFGTIREIHLSRKAHSPFIIHVQDVHGYVDAQQNIAGLIGELADHRGVNLVGVEAADGAFALEDLRRYPDTDVKERVASWAIKKDLIGGAEMSGIVADQPLTLWGVEDPALYAGNVRAVKECLLRRSEALAFHEDLSSRLGRLKAVVYSEEMKKYDENLLLYQEHRRGLADYLSHMESQSQGGRKAIVGMYPNVGRLLDAFDREAELDFKRVERERVLLVEQMADRLDERTLNGLMQESLAYRAGQVTSGAYYAYVKSLCHQGSIDLTRFPALTDYMAYVGLSEKINRSHLLDELERWEEAVAGRLINTELERRVLALSRDSVLMGKLVANALTPEEWAQYLDRRIEILDFENRVHSLEAPFLYSEVGDNDIKGIHSSSWWRKWGGVSQRGRVFVNDTPSPSPSPASGRGKSLQSSKELPALLKPFEEFCRLALARNQGFVDRLLAKMDESQVTTAVLVAGGFHTEGLTAEIKRRGGSYVVLTPRVEIIPNDKNYLDAFAHDPVPLEKLFDGEKISLLTARGTAVGGNATEQLALAMVLVHLGSLFGELLAKKRPLKQIRFELETWLAQHIQNLGTVFHRMEFSLGAISINEIRFVARLGGRRVVGAVSSDNNVRIFDSPSGTIDGFQNAYDVWEETPVGKWLKRNSLFAFKSIAEIYFAPIHEKHLTADLALFGKRHKFAPLPLSPLGWIGLVLDKSVDWVWVAKSAFGWLAIGLMAVAGFSPTLATIYFTFVGPSDLVQIFVMAFFTVLVGMRNYQWRTQAYVIPHGVINSIIVLMNLVLVGMNRVFPGLKFRFPRLTLGGTSPYSFVSPARGFDQGSKDQFRTFLQEFEDNLSTRFPTVDDSGLSPGFYQLVYLLALDAHNSHMDLAQSDQGIHSGVAVKGRALLEEIRLDEVQNLIRPTPPYSQWILADPKYKEGPVFSPETPGLIVAERFNDGSDPIVYAQVYDEWIRRCFFVALRDKARVDDDVRNAQLWAELINELAHGPVRSEGDRWEKRDYIKGNQLYLGNSRSYRIVVSPENHPVFLTVYSKKNIPGYLRAQAFQRGIPASEVYLVHHSAYGEGIMGLNEEDGEVSLGLNTKGLFTVVESNSMHLDPILVSYQEDQLTLYQRPGRPGGPELQIWTHQLSELGEQIRRELGVINKIPYKEAGWWNTASEEQKRIVANTYWGLRIRKEEIGPDVEPSLVREGFPREDVGLFRRMVSDLDLLAHVQAFDRPSVKNLEDLAELADVMVSPVGRYSEINVDSALAGIDVLKKRWAGSHGFYVQNNNGLFSLYVNMRTGHPDMARRLLEPKLKSLLSLDDLSSFQDRVRTRKDLELGNELYRSNPDLLEEEMFNQAAEAHARVWSKIKIDRPDFFTAQDLPVKKEILSQWLISLDVLGLTNESMTKYLLARDRVEEQIADRKVKIAGEGPSLLAEDNQEAGKTFVSVEGAREEDGAGLSSMPGASRLWEGLGFKNLPLAGVLESVVDVVAVSLYLLGAPGNHLVLGGMAVLDLTGTLVVLLVIGKFLVHFLGGVSQPGDAPAMTIRSHGFKGSVLASLGATWTASKSLVMVPFLVVAWMAPLSVGVALTVGVVGVLWGTFLHAWENYLLEIPYLFRGEPIRGVEVLSHPVDVGGNVPRVDPRATLLGFLKRVAFGGPAVPAYGPVERAVHSVHIKGTVTRDPLENVSIGENPGAWIADRVLSSLGSRDVVALNEEVRFLNIVVAFYREVKASPKGPVVIEVPSPAELEGNPTARMAFAAAVMAHGQWTDGDSRPLVLLARGTSFSGGEAWSSQESLIDKTVEAIQEYSPLMAETFAAQVKGKAIPIELATANQLNAENQFLLAHILRRALSIKSGETILSPLVLGEEAHFDRQGLPTVLFISYLNLATNLRRAMEKIALFSISA
jgi:hypothetical protein